MVLGQLSPDRDAGARGPAERRVGLYIDFQDLCRGTAELPAGDVAELAARLHDVAQEQGRLLVAHAYGDWSRAGAAAREFRRLRIEPRLVLDIDGAEADCEVALSLDVLETLFRGPDLDTVVLVTGERGYQELLGRIRRADRAVILVGLDGAVSTPFSRGVDRFVPLEALVGVRPGRRMPAADLPGDEWSRFVSLVAELESQMPFVGFGWLLKKKLNADNCGCATVQERQELMDRAVDEGILTLHKVDNIDAGADPVTACRLNRDSPRVKELLGR